MNGKGFVVPPGGGPVLAMAPGRSAALKLVSGETAGSIMLFEETVPSGVGTNFHLHRDSDEVAWVLSGEIIFKIGDEVTVGGPGTCAFIPRGAPHAWKNTSADTGHVLFVYTPATAGGFFRSGSGVRMARSTRCVTATGWRLLARHRFDGVRVVSRSAGAAYPLVLSGPDSSDCEPV
jgi:quercetin dioxygenase-like cupin family protein